jgi:salicylate hydroxylase
MSSPDRLIVIGGGIGGVATALAARRAGREVTVLEQAPAFTEVGAGLQMAPNATRVLRDLGVLDQVVEAGVLPEHLVFHNAVDGKELTRVRLDAAYEEHFGGPYAASTAATCWTSWSGRPARPAWSC